MTRQYTDVRVGLQINSCGQEYTDVRVDLQINSSGQEVYGRNGGLPDK